MRRSGKKYQPHLPRIQKIELPEKFSKWRLVLLIVLLIGGLALITTAAVKYLTKAPGWQSITAEGGTVDNCSGDFTLQYLLGQTDQPVNVENNSLTDTYTQACADAYRLFHSQESFEGVHNLHFLSTHPGEEAELNPALYNAIGLMERYGDRTVYLAPVHEIYRTLAASADDESAAAADPAKDEEMRTYLQQVMAFVSDPNHVKVVLLGENRAKLVVSEAYRDFAKTWEISAYLDFGWMQNAFVADFIAERLIAAGHTNGVLSSFDGFTRVLDTTGRQFSLNLFDRVEKSIYGAAVMDYSNVKALITLRTYPTNDLTNLLYYTWADGSLSHPFADPADGISKAALNDFVAYSRDLGCAQTLLLCRPVFVAEKLDVAALKALPGQDVEYAVFVDRTLYASDTLVTFSKFFEKDGIVYQRGDVNALEGIG